MVRTLCSICSYQRLTIFTDVGVAAIDGGDTNAVPSAEVGLHTDAGVGVQQLVDGRRAISRKLGGWMEGDGTVVKGQAAIVHLRFQVLAVWIDGAPF